MKQMLTRTMLTLALALMMAAPVALASQTAMAVRRHPDKAAVQMCNQTFREAKRAAQGLPRRERRIRMEQARREHKECLRRARH